MDEDKIAAETETPAPALDEEETQKSEEEILAEETKRKEQHLQNVNKAIDDANEILRSKRREIKSIKVENPEDEILPEIDDTDPNAKAWNKRIKEEVNPVRESLEQEKKEIRSYALREFLADKPLLAKDQTKMAALMDTYERLSQGKISEKTKEGVLIYLEKAYASENQEDLLAAAGQKRIEKAMVDTALSASGVTRGFTASTPSEADKIPHYTKEDEAIVMKWGYESYLDYYNQILKPKKK